MSVAVKPVIVRALITALSVSKNQRMVGRFDCYDNASLKFFVSLLVELNLKYKIQPSKEPEGVPGTKPGNTVYTAKKKEDILKVICYYPESIKGDNKILGKLYGYPDCCIKMFVKYKMPNHIRSDIEILYNTLSQSRGNIFSLYMNRFSPYKPVLHLPHSFDCQPSIEIGKYNMELLKEYDIKIYDYVIKQLYGCVLLYKDYILLVDDFLVKKDCVIINSFSEYGYLMNVALIFDGIKKRDIYLKSYNSYRQYWDNLLLCFRAGESYKIDLINSNGIKIIIFS